MRSIAIVSFILLATTACTTDSAPTTATADALVQPADAAWNSETAWRLTSEPVLEIKGSEEQVEQAPLDPVRAGEVFCLHTRRQASKPENLEVEGIGRRRVVTDALDVMALWNGFSGRHDSKAVQPPPC